MEITEPIGNRESSRCQVCKWNGKWNRETPSFDLFKGFLSQFQTKTAVICYFNFSVACITPSQNIEYRLTF